MQSKVGFSHIDYGHGITAITAPMGEQIYLIRGSQRALVIDTGMGVGSLKDYLNTLTDLPLEVVNTHAHPDHGGGNVEFKQVWLHPDDHATYQDMCSLLYRKNDLRKMHGGAVPEVEGRLLPIGDNISLLNEGQSFELGGRRCDVLPMEGHTAGSICIYDSTSGTLFVGDSVGNKELWLHLDSSLSLQRYYNALRDIHQCGLSLTQMFCGHRPEPLPPDSLYETLLCARTILLHDGKGDAVITFAGDGMRFTRNGATIIYNPNNIYDI